MVKTASRAGQGSRQRGASQAVPLHDHPAKATIRPQRGHGPAVPPSSRKEPSKETASAAAAN